MDLRSLLTAAGVAAVLFQQAAGEDGLLRGGGMEGPFVDGLAAGWVKNCYGSNEVVFAEESRDIHGGRAAQRVTCTKFFTGGVQFHSGDVAVEQGKPYTVRLWMKGDVRSPIYIGLRKHDEPYTSYLKRQARIKSQWRPYVLTGVAGGTDRRCGLYLMFAGTGTLLVDDVALLPAEPHRLRQVEAAMGGIGLDLDHAGAQIEFLVRQAVGFVAEHQCRRLTFAHPRQQPFRQ